MVEMPRRKICKFPKRLNVNRIDFYSCKFDYVLTSVQLAMPSLALVLFFVVGIMNLQPICQAAKSSHSVKIFVLMIKPCSKAISFYPFKFLNFICLRSSTM